MEKKIISIFCIIIIFFLLINPVFNAFEINIQNNKKNREIIEISEIKKTNDESNIVIYSWPNEDSEYPWNLFKAPLYVIGFEFYDKIWDDSGNRNCWEYKQKVMWWTSRLGINGEYCDDPYYDLDVEYWPEIEYGCYEGESFRFGGWNTTDKQDDGDFNPWLLMLCEAIIDPFKLLPVVGHPIRSGLDLASDFFKTSESIDPVYTWDGDQIYDASGCFEYDFHVEYDTDFSLVWKFRFSHTPGDPFVKTIGFRFDGISPMPPAQISLNPTISNYGDVKIDKTKSKSYTIKNEGITNQKINVYLSNENSKNWEITSGDGEYTLTPEQTKEVVVCFHPKNKGSKEIELVVKYDQQSKISNLFGNGIENNYKTIKIFNRLSNRYFLEKILRYYY